MLLIGQKVRIDVKQKREKGYKTKGWYIVQRMMHGSVYFKKDGSGYTESICLWDLRKGLYRLVTEENKVIRFKPLENYKATEQKKRNAELKEYRETIEYSCQKTKDRTAAGKTVTMKKVVELLDAGNDPDEIVEKLDTTLQTVKGLMVRQGIIPKAKKGVVTMLKMTKKKVQEMAAEGKTLKEIVEYFTQGNPKLKSMYTAKATLYLEGPKPTEKKKEPAVKTSLRAREMEDDDLCIIYKLGDKKLEVCDYHECQPIGIEWDKLELHIANLQKIKDIHESA